LVTSTLTLACDCGRDAARIASAALASTATARMFEAEA
jgi:hypothetical protein